MLSIERGLPKSRGLIEKDIFSESRGLKDIKKVKLFLQKYDDDEFEALINEDMDLIFKFSPTTDDILNKVYHNYSDLYGNDINFFRQKMSDKQFYEGKLDKEKILDELRNRKYWQKNRNMKRPEKFQYKKDINIDKL